MDTNPIFFHYKEEVTSITTLFRLDLKDGTKMGFTSFDKDIVIEDYTFKAFGGMTPSAISSTSMNNVDNLDVDGYLYDDSITESDLQAGRYDDANVIIYEINWQDKPYSFSKCRIKKKGTLGKVTVDKGNFIAEVRGLTQPIQNNSNELFQPTCRAIFGDSKCKVNKEDYQQTGTVVSVISNTELMLSSIDSGVYANGTIKFTSGLNENLEYEVKDNDSGLVTLQLPLSYTVSAGDEFVITQGCRNIKEDCFEKFNNMINFRGEPFVPNASEMINKVK